MSKRIIVFIAVLLILIAGILLSGCREDNFQSDRPDSSEVPESVSNIPEFNIIGKYICDNDYHKDEFFIENPESIPYITFNNDGSCKLLVNYLEGGCYMNGSYNIEDNQILVKLDFSGTIFEGTGTEYMDDEHVFTIISNDKIIIDKGFYTVNARDFFIK